MSRHSRGKSVDESIGSSKSNNLQALNSLVFSIPSPCSYEEKQFQKSELDKLVWVSSVNRAEHKIPVLHMKCKPKPKTDNLK